jgi:hypothetical protein
MGLRSKVTLEGDDIASIIRLFHRNWLLREQASFSLHLLAITMICIADDLHQLRGGVFPRGRVPPYFSPDHADRYNGFLRQRP